MQCQYLTQPSFIYPRFSNRFAIASRPICTITLDLSTVIQVKNIICFAIVIQVNGRVYIRE